jgi:hypothetical protein
LTNRILSNNLSPNNILTALPITNSNFCEQSVNHVVRGLHHVNSRPAKIGQYCRREGRRHIYPRIATIVYNQINLQKELDTGECPGCQLYPYIRSPGRQSSCSCVFERARKPRGIDLLSRTNPQLDIGRRWSLGVRNSRGESHIMGGKCCGYYPELCADSIRSAQDGRFQPLPHIFKLSLVSQQLVSTSSAALKTRTFTSGRSHASYPYPRPKHTSLCEVCLTTEPQ